MKTRDTNMITYQLIQNKTSVFHNKNITYGEILMITTNYDKALHEVKNNPELHIKQYEHLAKKTRKRYAR
ncbi:MAG: hypothetical protein COA44_09130 [Arcobacter sp.]|nr:MAG: hypothetical protein COA44_09130 [Arcobacter sp.]